MYDIWLPAAIRYGIDINTFRTLNPKIMYIYQEAYIAQKERELKLLDVSAFYNGMYIRQAIASCFSKNTKYPEKPLLADRHIEQNNNESEELTEEQKIEYQKQLLMQLKIMQSNFETGKK